MLPSVQCAYFDDDHGYAERHGGAESRWFGPRWGALVSVADEVPVAGGAAQFARRTPEQRGARAAGSLAAVVAAVLGGGLVVIVAVVLAARPNFWLDEATLFLALQHATSLAPGQPLNEYEASAPYGLALLYKAMISEFGLNEIVLRLPSAIAFLGGVAVVWRTAGRMAGAVGGVAGLVIAGYTTTTLQESTQFKQWAFEFLAASVVLWLGARCRHTASWRTYGCLAGTTIVLNLVANTAILVFVAVIVALGVEAVTARPRHRILRSPLAASAIVTVGAFAGWYFAVVRPANAFQLALPVYEQAQGLVGLWRICLLAIEPAVIANTPIGFKAAQAFLVLLAVGVVVAIWRRDRGQIFIVVATVVLFAELAAGTVTGVFPVLAVRNVIMIVPLVAVAFGSLWLHRRRADVPVLRAVHPAAIWSVVLVAAVALTVATGPIATVPLEQVGAVLATPAARTCGSIVPYYLASPTVQLYAGRAGVSTAVVFAGNSSYSGVGANAWEERVRTHVQREAQVAIDSAERRAGPLCIVVGRIPYPKEVSVLVDTAEQNVGACTVVGTEIGAELFRCGDSKP